MKTSKTRKITMTAMLGAVGFVLMMLNFNVPLMPTFIKMDFSEIPTLLASFALGPFWGVAVSLIKNVLAAIFKTTTLGVGELSNFIIGSAMAISAGLFYRRMKDRKGALIGSLLGALAATAVSVVSNYFLIYPLFSSFVGWPLEVILGMYQKLNANVQTLWDALIWFNAPFTAIKTVVSAVLVFIVYKYLSPLLKGNK